MDEYIAEANIQKRKLKLMMILKNSMNANLCIGKKNEKNGL